MLQSMGLQRFGHDLLTEKQKQIHVRRILGAVYRLDVKEREQKAARLINRFLYFINDSMEVSLREEEEWKSDLEDRMVEITATEQKIEIRMKK